ncbi:hypothetical protein NDU88_002509 [Pleurodeles waltl]|uniref:Uncharacterized protein n=1 Tax=Pleurodeles waltl TaxID=8319 RepID=A0AAV7UVY1_PLEWA|nr:hypothetical protein NDU88_002509 [Pleurodeles waltl]
MLPAARYQDPVQVEVKEERLEAQGAEATPAPVPSAPEQSGRDRLIGVTTGGVHHRSLADQFNFRVPAAVAELDQHIILQAVVGRGEVEQACRKRKAEDEVLCPVSSGPDRQRSVGAREDRKKRLTEARLYVDF